MTAIARSAARCLWGIRLALMLTLAVGVISASAFAQNEQDSPDRPNIILAMADDQGYGDAGYLGHPHVQTPTLDEMARNGLRFDRFYSAAPNCTPTRASVLTGRHPVRTGALQWGHALRSQELTLAEALKQAGYRTGHFGKWHLGPLQPGEPASPGESGFGTWLSAYNFYDNDPWFSREGKAVRLKGESSIVTVEQALDFMRETSQNDEPFLAVVWFGSPHGPHRTTDDIRALYPNQSDKLQRYLGELTGIDRAMNRLRQGLRELEVAEDTMLWYCSDNGGRLPHASNGKLRSGKGTLWEGGIRVPAIIEWPGRIEQRVTHVNANTSDIYPTVLELAGVKPENQPSPLDGVSLVPLLNDRMSERPKPMGFWHYPTGGRPAFSRRFLKRMHQAQQQGESPKVHLPVRNTPDKTYPKAKKRRGKAAWIDGDWKLHRRGEDKYELYNLAKDPAEQNDVIDDHPDRAAQMQKALRQWQQSVTDSLHGADYGEKE
jgi:arylsulfatase A-like enzyme